MDFGVGKLVYFDGQKVKELTFKQSVGFYMEIYNGWTKQERVRPK